MSGRPLVARFAMRIVCRPDAEKSVTYSTRRTAPGVDPRSIVDFSTPSMYTRTLPRAEPTGATHATARPENV